MFFFSIYQNIFSILNELREPSQARIDSVILCSVGTAFTVFLVVGLSGYFTYGSLVSSDLLKSYPGTCYSVLYCTVLYCTVLYCTVLYCTVQYSTECVILLS